MEAIHFSKMSGSGNDFIIIDNREAVVPEGDLETFIAGVCRRRLSVGADGLILIEGAQHADFKWRFFNSDGSRAEMCGNGARCAARFAYVNGICGPELCFETDAGRVEARISDGLVSLKTTDPQDLHMEETLDLEQHSLLASQINTGVPHVVVVVNDLNNVDVVGLGRTIRNHPRYAPAGTNANFIVPLDQHTIAIRTYERGVEDETLACGTGSIAGAVIAAHKGLCSSPVSVITRSGTRLTVYFTIKDDRYNDVRLEGDARLIYWGTLAREAW